MGGVAVNYDRDSFLAGLAVGRMLWRPPHRLPGPFDGQPICTHPPGTWPSDSDPLTPLGFQPHYDLHLAISASEDGIYCFGLSDMLHWYVVSRTNHTGITLCKRLVGGGASSLATISWALDAETGLYRYGETGGHWDFGFNKFYVPVYDSLRAGLDALRAYLDS